MGDTGTHKIIKPNDGLPLNYQVGQRWPRGKEIEGLYRIEGILGEGGMGLVYKALDISSNKYVVIKTLRPDYVRDERMKRLFIREAEEWVKLGFYPHIVRAHDVREIDWLPRIIAEYVDGVTLANLLSHGLLPLAKALDIAVQICWGMAFAHGHDIIHRDLKPENIFIDGDDIVKVGDFGLAKGINEMPAEMDKGESVISSMAEPEITVGACGTPPYMPPEQWQGQAGKQADIYSFGIILYELFCCKKPFDFSAAYPNAKYLLYRRAHEQMDPPQPEKFRREISPALSALMRQCLEKNPLNRPQEFRNIASVLNEAALDLFHLPLRSEPMKRDLGRQIKLDQAWALTRLSMSCKFHGHIDKALELNKEALSIFQNMDNKAGLCACYFDMGEILRYICKYEYALNMYQKSLKIAEEADVKIMIGRCYNCLAEVYRSCAEYCKAIEMLERSIAIAEAIDAKGLMSCCYNTMGHICHAKGEYKKALDLYEKSLVIDESLGDKDGMSTCFNNMGSVFERRGEYDKAMETYRKSLAIMETLSDKAGMSRCYNNMGVLYSNQGQYAEAVEMHEMSLSIATNLKDKAGISMYFNNMSKVYYEKKEYSKSIEMLEKSLNIEESLDNNAGKAKCYNNIGEIYRLLKEHDKALTMFEKSIAIKETLDDKDGLCTSFNNMGSTYFALGKNEKALELFARSLKIAETIGNKAAMSACYLNIGSVFSAYGEYKRALKLLEVSLKLMREIGDPRQETVSQYINAIKANIGQLQ